jgi:hypothetical protein
MTNEQYSNMMVTFAKLEAKIDSLEREITLLQKYYVDEPPTPVESFSRFLELNTNTGS